jgi:hypothetical protein
MDGYELRISWYVVILYLVSMCQSQSKGHFLHNIMCFKPFFEIINNHSCIGMVRDRIDRFPLTVLHDLIHPINISFISLLLSPLKVA